MSMLKITSPPAIIYNYVDAAGTPVANDFAKFSDADTVVGRSYAEVKTDLSLGNVEDTAHSTDAHTMAIDGRDVSVDGTKLDGIDTGAEATLVVITIADGATPTPAISARRTHYTITALAQNPTFGVPSGSPADGDTLLIRIKDDGTGRTLAWNAIYRSVTGTLSTSTTTSKTSYIGLVYNAADTKWDCLAAGEEA